MALVVPVPQRFHQIELAGLPFVVRLPDRKGELRRAFLAVTRFTAYGPVVEEIGILGVYARRNAETWKALGEPVDCLLRVIRTLTWSKLPYDHRGTASDDLSIRCLRTCLQVSVVE